MDRVNPLCGVTTLSVVALNGMKLGPENYLGENADALVQEAETSVNRAKRNLDVAEQRLADAKEERRQSQKFIDDGKVTLL